MLRPAEPKDTSKLIALAVATGLFTVDEADSLLGGVLERLFAGNLGTDHVVCVAVDSHADSPTGWVYFARNNNANQVWDLWWIGRRSRVAAARRWRYALALCGNPREVGWGPAADY